MLDSPKDDLEEIDDTITDELGNRIQRVGFLSGKANAEVIGEEITKGSPSWYSQVLGFPFLIIDVQKR